MLTKEIVITPPEVTLSPNGKLLPVAHVAVCEVITEDGAQVGKSKPHRVCLAMQSDGSWAFSPPPLHPVTKKPFEFTPSQVAAWTALLDTWEKHYGIVDHETSDGLTAVTYTRDDSGMFVRVETAIQK